MFPSPRHSAFVAILAPGVLLLGTIAVPLAAEPAPMTGDASDAPAESDADAPDSITADILAAGAGDARWLETRFGPWFAGASGTTRFGGSGAGNTDLVIERGLGLGGNEVAVTAELRLARDRTEIWIDGFEFGAESLRPLPAPAVIAGTSVPAGSTLTAELGLVGGAVHVGYDFFGDLVDDEADGDRVALHLVPAVGARWLEVDHDLRLGPGPLVTTDYDEAHLLLDVGGRFGAVLDLSRGGRGPGRFVLGVAGLAGFGGGDGTEIGTLDIRVDASWLIDDHLGVSVGYRFLDVDLEDPADGPGSPRFDFDGRLAGLVVGLRASF